MSSQEGAPYTPLFLARSLTRSLDLSPSQFLYLSPSLCLSLSSFILSSLFLSFSLRFSLPITHSRPCFRTESQSEAEYSLYLSLFILFVYPFSLFSLPLSADVCFIFFLYSPFLRSCAPKLGLVRRLLEASRLYFFISRFPCYIRRALRRDARGHTHGISVLHKYVAFSYRGRRKGRDVFAYELN